MSRFNEKNIWTLTKYLNHLRHLKSNSKHALTWNVLMTAPISDCLRKNLEVSFIALQ